MNIVDDLAIVDVSQSQYLHVTVIKRCEGEDKGERGGGGGGGGEERTVAMWHVQGLGQKSILLRTRSIPDPST